MSTEIEPEIIQIAQLLASVIEKRLNARDRQTPRDEELTVREVAKLKNVSERTVYEWVNNNKIPSHKTPGGGIRIFRSEIDKGLRVA